MNKSVPNLNRRNFLALSGLSLPGMSALGQEVQIDVEPVKIGYFGDSTTRTAIYDPSAPGATEGYIYGSPTVPIRLQKLINAAVGRKTVVINLGSDGATTFHLLNGRPAINLAEPLDYIKKFLPKLEYALAASKFDLIIFNFGINDAVSTNLSATGYKDNLITAARMATALGIPVVIETSNKVREYTGIGSMEISRVYDFAAAASTISEPHVHIVDQYSYTDIMTDLSDGVHPTQAHYMSKAQRLADTVIGRVEYLLSQPNSTWKWGNVEL